MSKKTNTRRTRRVTWMLSAAVALSLAGSAWAQYRVGSDGRALDANNRVGSGGVNEPTDVRAPYATGNQIVTGNITGGQQFRGVVPYTDPFAFRGTTSGIQSDRFIRESAGMPIRGVTDNNNASVIQPFYGLSQTVERPPGYALEAPGTGLVPAPRISREPGDLRLGRPIEEQQVTLPRPGQLVLPGPVDPNTQQPTVITASPLYGVRQWNLSEQTDQQFLMGLNEPARRTRLDQRTLDQMREELQRDGFELGTEGEATDGAEPRTRRPGDQLDSRSVTPLESPENRPLTGGRLQDRTANEAIAGGVTTGQRTMQRMSGPERQSTQYAELRRRLERYNRVPEVMADAEAHRRFNEQLRQQQERDAAGGQVGLRDPLAGTQRPGAPGATQQPGQPGQPGGLRQPDTGAQPGRTDDPTRGTLGDFGLPDYVQRSREGIGETQPPQDTAVTRRDPLPGAPDAGAATREPPLQIRSLAAGVQAKGLADLLKEAENLMQQGKFYSALDQYDLAEQVAPNQPMVALGRAIAELGASYYGRAEQHLREAFKDPALLMGQYDLEALLGRERLEYVITDLRAISRNETQETRSVFLLAFIDYNTGNPRRAAAYLDLAEKRGGRPDPLYDQIRKHWGLPSVEQSAPEDANK